MVLRVGNGFQHSPATEALKGINVRGAPRKQLASLLWSDLQCPPEPASLCCLRSANTRLSSSHNKKEIARKNLQGVLAVSIGCWSLTLMETKTELFPCHGPCSNLHFSFPPVSHLPVSHQTWTKPLSDTKVYFSKSLSLTCQILALNRDAQEI